MDRFRSDLAATGSPTVADEKGRHAISTPFGKTLRNGASKVKGNAVRVAMETDAARPTQSTTKIYTDAGQLPIWEAIGPLPMFNDTEIDTVKLSRKQSNRVNGCPNLRESFKLLGVEDEKLSPSETAAVTMESLKTRKWAGAGFEPAKA